MVGEKELANEIADLRKSVTKLVTQAENPNGNIRERVIRTETELSQHQVRCHDIISSVTDSLTKIKDHVDINNAKVFAKVDNLSVLVNDNYVKVLEKITEYNTSVDRKFYTLLIGIIITLVGVASDFVIKLTGST